MLIKVAIVEDNEQEAKNLLSCLKHFPLEQGDLFIFEIFNDTNRFLEEKQAFDIVFMDIILPNITGMEAAARLRRYNNQTVLIFVTSMAQYAIKSYEVDAFDYILKPVTFERVKLKLQKAIDSIHSKEGKILTINNSDGIAQIPSRQVQYIEVRGHVLSYHTEKGVLTEYGSLSALEKQLSPYDFMRCNACYLLNPNFIVSVNGLTVCMANGDELKISQPKRKSFMDSFTNWLGQRKS